jgi:hypothetical protein
MSKSTPAPLTLPVISRKGEATPAVASFDEADSRTRPPTPASPSGRLSPRVQATIAVTVRLDETRYERMKTWGAIRRVTNQEIIVAALDRFFGLSDEEREEGIARVRR